MRTVYQFKPQEMAILKVVSDRLHAYDGLFSDNLYSFRREVYIGDAIRRLFSLSRLRSMCVYKADIHDYFNSIPVESLLLTLKDDLLDDNLYNMIASILLNDHVIFKGNVISERKGIMAGIPISAFLSNYYLKDLDHCFEAEDCIYMRYADDIIILSDSQEKMIALRNKLIDFLRSKELEMNPDKERFSPSGQPFEFLGFQISDRAIDVSPNTIRKIKGRIRRSSKSIRRWMLRKNAPVQGTIRALIRKYNRLFFGYESGELSWARWYFSTITTSDSLHEIDVYFQEWLRYIATGRHIHKNHAIVPYDILKSCGYRSLVSEYYATKRFPTTWCGGDVSSIRLRRGEACVKYGSADIRHVFSPVSLRTTGWRTHPLPLTLCQSMRSPSGRSHSLNRPLFPRHLCTAYISETIDVDINTYPNIQAYSYVDTPRYKIPQDGTI